MRNEKIKKYIIMIILKFLFFVSLSYALCPCPDTECLNFTLLSNSSCFAEYWPRAYYNVRVKAHTSDGISNITVRTLTNNRTNPCTTTGTVYTDLSYTTPIDCFESSTYLINTCSTNGFTIVLKDENANGADAPTNYIFIVNKTQDCPTPAPTASPTTSPTTNAPSRSPTRIPTTSPTIATTTTTTSTFTTNAAIPQTSNQETQSEVVEWLVAAGVSLLIFGLMTVFLIYHHCGKRKKFVHVGGGGDENENEEKNTIPLREKRASRSHSRGSSSKRQSTKFLHSEIKIIE